MFQRIVVPLDGSSLAERALPYAVRLAVSGRGRLILMHAALARGPRAFNGSACEDVGAARHYLSDVAATLPRNVPVETVAVEGHPAAQILATAQVFQADAVVMASHGRTGLPHLLLGSITEAVLTSCLVPVFVVHARADQPPLHPFVPDAARILVPQDGSPYDAAALHAALEIAGARSELMLMSAVASAEHVLDDGYGHVLAYLDQQDETRQRQVRDQLELTARQLHGRGEPVEVSIDVRTGDPAACIRAAATDRSADLIVMATHGLTGLRRAMVGSVAGTVLRTAPTPLLLVHPRLTSGQTAEIHAGSRLR